MTFDVAWETSNLACRRSKMYVCERGVKEPLLGLLIVLRLLEWRNGFESGGFIFKKGSKIDEL